MCIYLVLLLVLLCISFLTFSRTFFCFCFVFFFNDPATTEIYPYGHTLSLHDALPILSCSRDAGIGAEKVAKECVEVGRPRALDFLARENRIGLRLILAARDVGIERPAALAEYQNFRDILLAVHIAVAGADIGGEPPGLLVTFLARPGDDIGSAVHLAKAEPADRKSTRLNSSH